MFDNWHLCCSSNNLLSAQIVNIIQHVVLVFQDPGFSCSRNTTYWTDLFVRHFLFQSERYLENCKVFTFLLTSEVFIEQRFGKLSFKFKWLRSIFLRKSIFGLKDYISDTLTVMIFCFLSENMDQVRQQASSAQVKLFGNFFPACFLHFKGKIMSFHGEICK